MRASKGFAKEHQPKPTPFQSFKVILPDKTAKFKINRNDKHGNDFEDGWFVSPVFCCVLKTG